MGSEPLRFRTDVHALRAVAVVLVLVYHLDIGWLRGGFVGVDAFFVVSGFLITAHLRRELVGSGRVDLARFWARRIRRLAPSALLVLVVTAAVAVTASPREDWPGLGTHLIGGALSIENWVLAASSTDYLQAGAPSSPFEHFWSLGVEDQFYVVWPLLLGGVWWAARGRRPLVVVGVVVAGITVASLVSSVVLTATDPAPAYFWPHTRAWELGAGALLALAGDRLRAVVARAPRTATTAAVTGWLGLVATAVLLPASVPYPGLAAVLPVVATLLVIAAAREPHLVSIRPVRWLGSISYPLYLWHWPVVLLLPRLLSLPEPTRALVAVVLSLVLAHLTHVLVERPVLRGHLARIRPRTTFAVAAGALAIVLVTPTAGFAAMTVQQQDDRALVARMQADGCFGAAAIAPASGCAVQGDPDEPFTPSTLTAAYDIDPTWDDCEAADTAARSCVVGVPGGTRVALIGDSHAHQWASALTALAEERGWELHLYVKGGCEFSHVRWEGVSAADARRCATWNAQVDRSLAGEAPYSLVLTSSRADLRGDPEGGAAGALRGYRASWAPLIARGARVVAIHDTPAAGTGVQRCLDDRSVSSCSIDTARAFASPDRLVRAAEQTVGASVVDLTSSFCVDGSCPAVIGNVLVYRDSQHLTRTYVDTLTVPLGRALDRSRSAR